MEYCCVVWSSKSLDNFIILILVLVFILWYGIMILLNVIVCTTFENSNGDCNFKIPQIMLRHVRNKTTFSISLFEL